MDNTVYLSAAIILIISPLATGAGKWGYTGKAGPDNWHQQFEKCAGKKQSPIDIKAEETMFDSGLKEFAIWYDPPKPNSNITVKNNGHTLQVDLEGEFYVSNGGLKHVYKAAQFHFHWGKKVHHGSEHLIEGKASPIEMHLVTYNQELYEHIGQAATETGGLAVLGTMFEISKEDNPAFTTLVKAIKHIRDPHRKVRIRLPVESLSIRNTLPEDISRYYRYQGSLTTPHCHESVIWTVFEQKQTISEAQLKEFRTLLQFGHHRHHKDSAPPKTVTVTSDGEGSDGHSRQRRSMTRGHKRQGKYERDMLVELGIKGDYEEEAYFKEAVLGRKQREMYAEAGMVADQPADPSQNQLEKHGNHEDHKEAGKTHTKQDVLVNNYRPVQPLNGRVVTRSFKLRETEAVGSARSEGQRVSYATVDAETTGQGGKQDCDGATSLWSSLLVLVVSLLSVLFVV